LCGWGTSTVQALAGAFLSSPRYANPNTRRGYTGVLDRLLAGLGASRPLAEVSGEELAGLLDQLWGPAGPGDLEPQPRRRDRLAGLVRRQPAARPRSRRPAPNDAASTSTPPARYGAGRRTNRSVLLAAGRRRNACR